MTDSWMHNVFGSEKKFAKQKWIVAIVGHMNFVRFFELTRLNNVLFKTQAPWQQISNTKQTVI